MPTLRLLNLRPLSLVGAILLATGTLHAQPFFLIEPDTLVVENFDVDPTFNMLPFPTGDDEFWVNYDADERPTLCAEIGQPDVPGSWYWESDLGDTSAAGNNYCYTSCSYIIGNAAFPTNKNWLVLPRIFIPDSTYFLSWRSTSVLGPAYVDGYKVLLSTGSNNPDDFQYADTLFTAAEMIGEDTFNSIDPAVYYYTPGYVHADKYTNPDYYFLAYLDNGGGGTIPFLHGKLEPHTADLSTYAGQNVYIAFVHDSDQDFLLQIDDILVTNNTSSGAGAPDLITRFETFPNPAVDEIRLQWALKYPADCLVEITDAFGRVVYRQTLGNADDIQLRVACSTWPSGLYVATLHSEGRVASRKLVKQ